MKIFMLATFAFAILSVSAPASEAQGSSLLLAQNCGGYGVTECPGAKTGASHKESETAPAPAKESANPKDDCAKGGYGVAGCPGYSSKSSSGESTTDEEAAKRLQGCGGYGVNDCPKAKP